MRAKRLLDRGRLYLKKTIFLIISPMKSFMSRLCLATQLMGSPARLLNAHIQMKPACKA